MPALPSPRSLVAITRRVNVSTYISIGFVVTLLTPWLLYAWWQIAGPARAAQTDPTLVFTGLVIRSVIVAAVGVFIVRQLRGKERLQAELVVARQMAEHASRAKSELLANTSHELRTPLNAIIGFSNVIQKGMFGPLSARYQEYAGDIFTSGTHLLNVINDILDLAKLEAGQLSVHEDELDLGAAIRDSLRLVATQAEKTRVKLVEVSTNDYPVLRADGRRIRQILINLLSNAVKFTPENGRVQVAVSRSKGMLNIEVSDTGIGMRPEQITKALEPFGQIDSKISRKYQGTGLGLPIARHLAELHGGGLTIRSEADVGTLVTVSLPVERIVVHPPRLVAAAG